MNETNHWYQVRNTEEIDTPALLIYPERAKENIRLLKAMIDDPRRLRPHVKTHKTKEATLLMMEAGIRKFKCATIAEAEMLGMCEAEDVLLAYQPVGPKLQRFVNLIKQYPATRFSCLTDNLESARHIAETASSHDVIIPVFIDLNVGMNRTGIAPGVEAIDLYEACAQLKGVDPVGLHFYDGHIREKDLGKRTQACHDVFAPVAEMRYILTAKGFAKPKIVAGGSPGFPVYAKIKEIECSPGTFIYWDKGYQDALPEQPFLSAALLMTRVVSLPDQTKVCLDLGYKAIAAENSLEHRIFFPDAPDLKVIGQSEEHLVIEVPGGHSWKVGDVLYGIPIHICPTCALYESATIIEAGTATGTWEIMARDRKIRF